MDLFPDLLVFDWECTYINTVHENETSWAFSACCLTVTALDVVGWSPWELEQSSVHFLFTEFFVT